jgi:hypothetical protein
MTETENVVWLQVGDDFADSRGFAGRTTYDGGAVRWQHDVGFSADDVGRLAPYGDGLIETGDGYVEVWQPLPGATAPVGVWDVEGARIVRVGDYVVHVDSAGATLSRTGETQP